MYVSGSMVMWQHNHKELESAAARFKPGHGGSGIYREQCRRPAPAMPAGAPAMPAGSPSGPAPTAPAPTGAPASTAPASLRDEELCVAAAGAAGIHSQSQT